MLAVGTLFRFFFFFFFFFFFVAATVADHFSCVILGCTEPGVRFLMCSYQVWARPVRDPSSLPGMYTLQEFGNE